MEELNIAQSIVKYGKAVEPDLTKEQFSNFDLKIKD